MAEGNFAGAIQALETGFCLSRHLGEAPFLISSLVGVAMGSIFADTLLDFIELPNAPNLYWPLTALPRPLMSIRKGEEFEQKMMELQFPDLADLERSRTPKQWDAVLGRVRKEFEPLLNLGKNGKPLPEGITAADPASKSPDLAAARKYLIDQRGLPGKKVKEMPPAQVLVLAMAAAYRDFSDDQHKVIYLPYPKARLAFAAAEKRLKDAPDNEVNRLARTLLPALGKVLAAQNRLDRRIAALRVIEALRLHAAANDGKLPGKLEDVTAVVIPNDPGTGKPFAYEYDAKKGIATLTGIIPGEPPQANNLRYRLKIRQK
jgi:hypothetical protein